MTSRLKTIYVVWAFLTMVGVPGLSWAGSIVGNLCDLIVRPPTNLGSPLAFRTSIHISWADNSNNETGFKIERSIIPNSGFFEEIATGGANTNNYLDTGLISGIKYYYRVRAFNSDCNSSYSNTASARTASPIVIPLAPSGLGASAVSSTRIDLTWTDNSDNETGFKIQRSTSSSSGFDTIRTTNANVTSYSDTGLTAGTRYYYRVRATNSAGDSGKVSANATTTAAVTIPSAPQGLGALAVSSTQINLVWRDNSNNETGFKIQRSTSSSSGFTNIHTTNADGTSYSDTGLTAGTRYYYRVRATNSAGNSDYSNTVNATTEPIPPVVEEGILRLINDMTTITVEEANTHWGTALDATYFSGSDLNSIVTLRISKDEPERNAAGQVELSEFEDELLEPVGAFCYQNGTRIPNRSMEVIHPGNDHEEFDVDGGRYFVAIEMGYYGRDPDRSHEEDGITCYKKYSWHATWVEINQTGTVVELKFCENFIETSHPDYDFLCR